MQYELFVSCPRGLEYLLEDELKALGLSVNRVSPQGVYGTATLATIYRLCLWTRLANRVQLILFTGLVSNESLISKLTQEFPWQTVFSVDDSFAVHFHGTNSHIRNTMYGAQVVKDGIVDYFRSHLGQRPSVDKMAPKVQIHAYLQAEELTVSLDLSGGSLHQRGYRLKAGDAPIKENIAAALLMRAGWLHLSQTDYAFHDPFCGSGTLVIEAAMMAAGIAPGILRETYGFMHWVGYEAALWNKIREEALEQVRPVKVSLLGTDIDSKQIEWAVKNAERAGVSKIVHFQVKPVDTITSISEKGLLLCNPPYGERLGDVQSVLPLYQKLGQVLHQNYLGWRAGVLTEHVELARAIGLRSSKQYSIHNGPLACHLYLFELEQGNVFRSTQPEPDDAHVEMLMNRLKKNNLHLAKWAKRIPTDAYRVYDSDIPEYAFALDKYGNSVVLQEYMPPKTIPPAVAEKRRLEMVRAVQRLFALSSDQLVFKQRQAQKGLSQYEKIDDARHFFQIQEGAAKLLVNLKDYLDTGVFLDHRSIRRTVFGSLPPGTRFLNLFCYTATASVHAALSGALTTNVDLSKRYLRWAEDNFRLNHLSTSKH